MNNVTKNVVFKNLGKENSISFYPKKRKKTENES